MVLVDHDVVAAAIGASKGTNEAEVVAAVTNLGAVGEEVGGSLSAGLIVSNSERLEVNLVDLKVASLPPAARDAAIRENVSLEVRESEESGEAVSASLRFQPPVVGQLILEGANLGAIVVKFEVG